MIILKIGGIPVQSKSSWDENKSLCRKQFWSQLRWKHREKKKKDIFVSFEKDKPEIQVVGPILLGVWDVRQQKKCQCVTWAYPLHTPFLQMIRCELNFMHSAVKKGGVFFPRQSHFLLLQSKKKWRANVAASKEQCRGWAGVTFWEEATATLCSTSTSTLAPSWQPCTCLCCLASWGGLSSAFLAAKGGQCWRPHPLLGRVCPGWLLSLARLQELPEGHSSSQNTALHEATALQNLPFFFNFQTHFLFPYVSKHVRYFERDLLRTC